MEIGPWCRCYFRGLDCLVAHHILLIGFEQITRQKGLQLSFLEVIIREAQVEVCLFVRTSEQFTHFFTKFETLRYVACPLHDILELTFWQFASRSLHLIDINLIFVEHFAVFTDLVSQFEPVLKLPSALSLKVEIGSADFFALRVVQPFNGPSGILFREAEHSAFFPWALAIEIVPTTEAQDIVRPTDTVHFHQFLWSLVV